MSLLTKLEAMTPRKSLERQRVPGVWVPGGGDRKTQRAWQLVQPIDELQRDPRFPQHQRGSYGGRQLTLTSGLHVH